MTDKKIDILETVGEFKQINRRENVNGKFNRRCINPGDDYSKEEPEVREYCKSVHTPDVVEAYEAHKASAI